MFSRSGGLLRSCGCGKLLGGRLTGTFTMRRIMVVKRQHKGRRSLKLHKVIWEARILPVRPRTVVVAVKSLISLPGRCEMTSCQPSNLAQRRTRPWRCDCSQRGHHRNHLRCGIVCERELITAKADIGQIRPYDRHHQLDNWLPRTSYSIPEHLSTSKTLRDQDSVLCGGRSRES